MTIRRACSRIHLAGVSMWAGALVMTGVFAALIFPTLRDLAPALPGYASYTGEHWRVAAGAVASRVFAVSDVAQAGLAIVAVTAWVIANSGGRGGPRRGIATWVEGGLTGAAAALLAGRLALLTPVMDRDLRAYWADAAAGDTPSAEAHRAAFEARHPAASGLMQANAAMLLATLVLACRTGRG